MKIEKKGVSWYLVIKEGQSFDLKYEEVVLVCAGHVLRLHRLDRRRQDGPLKLQDSVAHIHFAHVAKVMSALISVGCQEVLISELRLQGGNISVCHFSSSPTFLQHLPSTPHPRILGGSSTGTCGTDSQNVH